jgi:methylthioribose-1-phosphate isomerase
MKSTSPFKTLEWKGKALHLLDQTRLPWQECYRRYTNHRQVAEAIRTMVVRGAPAIGVAAAFGMVLGALRSRASSPALFRQQMKRISRELLATRPTAVNLLWALQRMEGALSHFLPRGIAAAQKALEKEALLILAEDQAANREMGRQGQMLIPDGASILTHCNAGALATAGFGTALGVIRAALAAGKRIHVFIDETRPFLQGSRLTAWELMKDRVPCTLITDNMAGALMAQKKVDLAIVGADRIAANGDVANKIGTYSLACLCHLHRIPLYVAAPISTIDLAIKGGGDIPIEQRNESEVTELCGRRIAPHGIKVWNPAFDVTPNRYLQAIITERGIVQKPFQKNLLKLFAVKS